MTQPTCEALKFRNELDYRRASLLLGIKAVKFLQSMP
jgi:hypothetical protein